MMGHTYFVQVREYKNYPEGSSIPVFPENIEFIANIPAWLLHMGKKFANIFRTFIIHDIHMLKITIILLSVVPGYPVFPIQNHLEKTQHQV